MTSPCRLILEFLRRVGVLTALAYAISGCSISPASAPALDISVGEVDDRSAVIWVAGPPTTDLTVRLLAGTREIDKRSLTLGKRGYAHLPFAGLRPATRYTVNVSGTRRAAMARFGTAPSDHSPTALRFLFSADLAGQNACRDAQRQFPIFSALNDQPADFFIGLGDMIYADGECRATGPFNNPQIPRPDQTLGDMESFSARWRYNNADPGFRRLRRSMAYVPVWDDHEVVNDFGPQTARLKDRPEQDLLAPGRAAFFANNPLRPAADDPTRLYRRFRHGRHAEFFVLDTRQYRDLNDTDDTGVLPKSMLGATQRQWLIDGLSTSSATWKFVISTVPITIPTGYPATAGRDGWASGEGDDGFERELYAIFDALAGASVSNLIWLSGDVHFATGFKLTPLPQQPAFDVHEFIVGPLSAGMFPSRAIDTTFAPKRLYYHALDSPPTTLDEALRGYNFGAVNINTKGELRFELFDGHGDARYSLTLAPRETTDQQF